MPRLQQTAGRAYLGTAARARVVAARRVGTWVHLRSVAGCFASKVHAHLAALGRVAQYTTEQYLCQRSTARPWVSSAAQLLWQSGLSDSGTTGEIGSASHLRALRLAFISTSLTGETDIVRFFVRSVRFVQRP
jgi:hypothetical protein